MRSQPHAHSLYQLGQRNLRDQYRQGQLPLGRLFQIMSDTRHILIAGGGIGGLTAAIILAQHGAQVRLIEQADHFAEIGAGLQQSPNAMQVHAAMGTDKAVIKAGFEPDFAALRDYKTGRAQLTTPLKSMCIARYGQPYIHIHRADLQSILVQTAKDAGVTFHMGHTVKSYEQNSLFVTLQTDKDIFGANRVAWDAAR